MKKNFIEIKSNSYSGFVFIFSSFAEKLVVEKQRSGRKERKVTQVCLEFFKTTCAVKKIQLREKVKVCFVYLNQSERNSNIEEKSF